MQLRDGINRNVPGVVDLLLSHHCSRDLGRNLPLVCRCSDIPFPLVLFVPLTNYVQHNKKVNKSNVLLLMKNKGGVF